MYTTASPIGLTGLIFVVAYFRVVAAQMHGGTHQLIRQVGCLKKYRSSIRIRPPPRRRRSFLCKTDLYYKQTGHKQRRPK